MYFFSLSQVFAFDSITVCWKLDIFRCRSLVLPNRRSFVMDAMEHLFHMLMVPCPCKTTVSPLPEGKREINRA